MKRTLFFLSLLLSACTSTPKALECITPQPQHAVQYDGSLCVKGASISVSTDMDAPSIAAVERFAKKLENATGFEHKVSTGRRATIEFAVNPELADEAYTIDVTSRKVYVKASGLNGFIYAIQSIYQMLPAEIYGKNTCSELDWSLPYCEIKDAPAFAYRGIHMDPSRHFFPLEEVYRYIDVMEMYKLNRLHWHLTDDQGWRVEIKALPRLTEIGSRRKGTLIGHGRYRGPIDNVEVSGFYTQDEIRDVIAYAAERGITIIPEIDLPGHMLAALAAYPELGCKGHGYEVWPRWGVSDQVLCVGNEDTFKFLETVLGEICDLFPSEYIHIGGDECPKKEWHKCPKCQALIKKLGLKDGNGFTAEQYLQNYVTKRMQDFLATRGRKIIGWDEILEGELAPGATVMSWRGSAGGQMAASKGFDAIMTPYSHFYFDYYQSEDQDSEPLAIGGYIPVEKVYAYDPFDAVAPENHHHIIGVQANVWSEYIATCEHLEYMLLPRLLALSEVQWSLDNRDWTRFRANLVGHEFKVLDEAGYNYRHQVNE